jgi:hypothetical protein
VFQSLLQCPSLPKKCTSKILLLCVLYSYQAIFPELPKFIGCIFNEIVIPKRPSMVRRIIYSRRSTEDVNICYKWEMPSFPVEFSEVLPLMFQNLLHLETSVVLVRDEDGGSRCILLGHNHFHFLSYRPFISRTAVYILFTY